MRKHAKRIRTGSLPRIRRFQVICALAVVIVFAIAATAISLQASKGENAKGEKSSQSAGNYSRGNSLALRSAQDGHQDDQTYGQTFAQAQIRPLTQEEAQQMAEGIKSLVNQSTDGLEQVQHMDGSVSLDLEGRFQSVAVAKRGQDGKVIQSCVDNRQAAAAFFGIDPQLVGVPRDAASPKADSALPEKGGNQ